MLKKSGTKFYFNKSSEVIAESDFTFMTWFGLSDVLADVTLFHSTGLSVIIQNGIVIAKANAR